jgi:hypothetical protein
MSTSSDTIATTDNNIQQQLLYKQEKLIQRKKIDLMAIHITRAEVKFYQCQKIFNHQLSKMKQNHRNLVKNQGMTTTLTNLIEKRFINITNKLLDTYNYRTIYYIQNSYDNLDDVKQNTNEQNMKTTRFSSRMIIDATHQLTDKQIQLLNRGPTYVPPCQMHISSSCQSIDDIVKKQYAPLKHQLACIFSKYRVNIALSMEIEEQINVQFNDLFSIPIPSSIRKRALYEMELVRSIQHSLKNSNLILRRTADNQNTFYLGNVHDFEAKADDYLAKTDTYKLLITIYDESNEQPMHDEFKEMIESINFALETLEKRNAVDKDLFDRLHVNASKVELPYLYFLPDISKVRNL